MRQSLPKGMCSLKPTGNRTDYLDLPLPALLVQVYPYVVTLGIGFVIGLALGGLSVALWMGT